MHGILINPMDRTVMDIETDGSLDSLYLLLQCDAIEATRMPAHHMLWLAQGRSQRGMSLPCFTIRGYEESPFVGMGLLLGSDQLGDMAPATVTPDFIWQRVSWEPPIHTLAGMAPVRPAGQAHGE